MGSGPDTHHEVQDPPRSRPSIGIAGPVQQAGNRSCIPLFADVGYDGVEICVAPDHVGSMPDQIDATRRQTLKALLRHHQMGVPALLVLREVLQEDDGAHRDNL